MNPLLTTLGSRLAERWLNLLVLPGALFLGAVAAGATLGHAGWHDLDRLRTAVDDVAGHAAADRTGTAALLVVAVLLLAAAASLAAQFLGGGVERYWLRETGDPVSQAFVGHRRRRWKRREEALQAAYEKDLSKVPARRAARDRVALVEPSRPTWYGDRMEAAAERVYAAYELDLAAVWPRLWLVLAEPAQRQVGAARDGLTGAARLAAWAVGYAVLSLWWWPSAVIAAGCALTARSRARDAVEAFAVLMEAAADVHGRELAARIGLVGAESAERLQPGTGEAMSELFRKAD